MDFLTELRASVEAHNCGWTEKVQPHTYTTNLMNLVARRKLRSKKKSLEYETEERESSRMNSEP